MGALPSVVELSPRAVQTIKYAMRGMVWTAAVVLLISWIETGRVIFACFVIVALAINPGIGTAIRLRRKVIQRHHRQTARFTARKP